MVIGAVITLKYPHVSCSRIRFLNFTDDSDIEYFPISPTLTRIRVHKNVKPISEILCYPFTVHHQPLLSSTSPSRSSSSQVFSTYKRTAPSSTSSAQPSPKLPTRPPSPPKRRSSRNSHTLRLISTMTIHTHSPKSSRRHETCFKSTADKSNVKFLRDRISCKLRSPTNSKKGVRVTKTISTYPSSSRESISSGKDSKLGGSKVKSKTDVSCKKEQAQHYSRSTASSTAKRCCHHCSFSVPPKLPDTSKLSDKVKHRGVSLERTFGSEKRKVDLTPPKMSSDRLKLVKSPDLVSPTEVKKGVQRQKDLLNLETKYYPPGTTVKKSTSLFSSTKNGLKSVAKPDEKALNVTVAITQRGKELLSPNPKSMLKSRSPSPLVSKSPSTRNITSPAPSNISDKSKTSHKSRTMSVESLQSSTLRKRTPSAKPSSISRFKSSSISSKDELSGSDRERKRSKKVKKDQSNEELKKEKKKTKENRTKDGDKTKTKKCAGRAAGSEIVRKLKKMESTEKIPELIKSETIAEKQKDILQSDSFFQHLFLRDMLSSPTYSIPVKSSYVLERTKMLQNHAVPPHYVEPTVKALKVYLTHRKPVSESKFMALDREVSRSRSTSPLVLSRSLSERRRRFDSISELSNEESICGKRSISPESIYSRRSSSLPATKIVFSETSRPVSPVCDRSLVKYGKRNSPSPSPIRSPSRRRIHSIKPPASITVEGISGVKKKAVRARSAGEVESMKRELYLAEKSLTPSVSSVSLSQITDPHEYKTYVTELRHSAKKSDRFKELNHFYTSLERLSQLELTTSSSDLRPRRRHEDEIIDYDRWMQVRTRERAEQEFNYLYSKLKRDQKEKDLLFRPKDVDKFRWKHDREFAFRLKDNSVENIKEKFEQLKVTETPLEISKRRILDYQKDVYKPLWRGSSVLNLVSKIGDKRSQSDSRTAAAQQRMICPERLLTREIGSKLWSSLSVEQVNALKHQLAEIYSQTPQKKQDDYSINVESHTKAERPSSLVIRRNSANELSSQKPQIKKSEYVKSSSIGALASSQSLSENEKRRLSMSLSKEVHDKMTQRRKYISSLSVVLGKETRGAIAAAEANVKLPVPESTSPRTCYSLEPAEDETGNKQKSEKDFLLVLTKDESEEQKQNVRKTLEEWAQPKSETSEIVPKQISSTSETESASSDTSTKTAIFLGKKDELHKKIEYFERGADSDSYVPTIHRPADDDNDLTSVEDFQQSEPPVKQSVKKSSNLAPSQSYADLKELFGEKELMKFATLPLSATRKHISPQRPLLRASNISPIRTLSEASSCESLFRSRSMSPESEKFWNAYLALIKGADVRKLTEKFETLKDFYSNRTSSHRRSKSDTELTHTDDEIYRDREFGDVYWLKKKYENIGRGRSRTRRDGKTSPISRIPLRVEDRLMPHINIISKLASLYPKKALTSREKQKSVEDLAKELGCPVGEVEKIREKFESPDRSVSLLGHMFTSSPNVHELRDIAPYLAGQWIAHQYPRYQDNTRSLSAPEETTPDKRLVRRDHHSRPKSASPPRSRKQPSSILKSHHHQQHRSQKDIYANQYYDPSVHRPTYRYQPHSPRAVDRGRTRSWSPSAKHTVTFKGGDIY